MVIKYLTFHMLFLLFLKEFFKIDIVNLHYLTFIVFVGGCYITFIKQFLVIKTYIISFELQNRYLVLANILVHILPFIYIYQKYEFTKDNIYLSICYLILYTIVLTPYKNHLKNEYYITEKTETLQVLLILSICTIFFLIL
jgi:hypothetical protein